MELGLEDQPGVLCLHVSITALSTEGSNSDLQSYQHDPEKIHAIEQSFSLLNTPKAMKEIGWLQVNIKKKHFIKNF